MPKFQISSTHLKQTVNTILESDTLSNVMLFFSSISTSTILEVRKYIDIPRITNFRYISSSRYATVKFKKDGFQQVIKIPSLKIGITERDISNYIYNIYTNISNLSVTIVSSV